ncbi:MAG: hypothetical protein ABSB74_10705 [Tepidisphaeraceae bacterium]
MSGPVAGKEGSISYRDALDIRVRWFAIEQFDCRGLSLLASKATLITANLADQAVLPATSLTSNACIGWFQNTTAEQAMMNANRSRYFEIGQSRAALPNGTTVSFRAFEAGGVRDQTLIHPEPRFVEVSLSRIAGGSAGATGNPQIALAIEDSADRHTPHSDSPNWPAGVYEYEMALLDDPMKGFPQAFLLIVPFRFAGPPNQAVAAFVTISRAGDDAGFKDAVARCKTDLEVNQSATVNPLWTLGLLRAVNELDDPYRRRAALVYLAGQRDARLCEDVAMLADEALLERIAAVVQRDAPAAINDGNLAQYAWILDRSAIQAMQPLLTKAVLPPELFAVLTEHFGEPGRHAAAVDEIMRGTSSGRQLQEKLISENYIYLEDSSPAARVRAFEWLAAQKLAPAGFDPLGSPKQRRQALDQALSGGAIPGSGQ